MYELRLNTGCYAMKTYPVIKLSECGSVTGDKNFMAEIFARGPVSVYINAYCIEMFTGGINLCDTCNSHTTNH
jgi:hypothetical protein